ncbi:hypothetical protein AB0D04_25815 [Streptomyces sp. NPDC048483]|uniref:hypothetical protein n=1 Tax=Streptomyces sp. NPDC048483 TaxID=3154927 RepID=UPI00343DB2AF
MSITLTDQDKLTLRTAAYGAVALLSAAGATRSPGKIATEGSIACPPRPARSGTYWPRRRRARR